MRQPPLPSPEKMKAYLKIITDMDHDLWWRLWINGDLSSYVEMKIEEEFTQE